MSFIINGTSGATFPDSTTQATGVPSPGTAGNVLTSNGTIWTSAAAAAFDTGTRMSFQQTAAPTGWTKDTTAAINDSMLRFVTGAASSGGTTAFSTWSAVTSTGSYTLATADIPSHTHNWRIEASAAGNAVGATNNLLAYIPSNGVNMYRTSSSPISNTVMIESTGGGGGHSHSLTRSLKYYDFIIASKN
jgi:microcystin-dependent protein